MSRRATLLDTLRSFSTAYSDNHICNSCLRKLQRRQYASAAAVPTTISAQEPSPVIFNQKTPHTAEVTPPHARYKVKAGVVLSRPPQITRDLTPFEKSFFLYQKRLNERQTMNFMRYFYYQKETTQLLDFQAKVKARKTDARDIGGYQAYGEEGERDEALVGDRTDEPGEIMEALLKDTVPLVQVEDFGAATETAKDDQEVERPQSRVTKADEERDLKSLNGRLQRTLHLMVRGENGDWQFPSDFPNGSESLHRAAERIMVQTGGVNMNTWVVGRQPIGHYRHATDGDKSRESSRGSTQGETTFFMKARIMAGECVLGSGSGWKEYKWLTKEEICEAVGKEYWLSIRNMLPDR